MDKEFKFAIFGICFYFGWRMLRKEVLTDKNREIEILARTVYGEARGEGLDGQQAVANVILNRAKNGGWWGATIEDVCLKPYQFSCWNPQTVGLKDAGSVANYNQMMRVDRTNLIYNKIYEIAEKGVNGTLPDNTGGATNYHAVTVMPQWALSMAETNRIGNHIFYS